jgi:FAD/FMN-containing dehydrogenase
MSAFNSISIGATTRTAKVGPAVRSAELVKALAAEGLACPVGHCGTPGIGGFLLGGGIGLNFGHWKPAWQRLIDLKRIFDPHGTFHGFPGAGFDKTPSS